MLVLKRKENEEIFILLPDGKKIQVSVTKIDGDRVGLGFIAPKEIIILRREVYERGLERSA